MTSANAPEVVFTQQHPLGLPADRYSHPLRILGNGTFGKVYLCYFRPPPQPAEQPSSDVRQMSIDLDGPAGVAPDHATQPQQPLEQMHPPAPEWIAVKIFKPLVQMDMRSLEYLKREVVNQRRLQHPHVIGFREVGITVDRRIYLALEYADSGNLKQWLADRGGRLPEASARWFAQQLVYGLAYCHAHGVYNRDIKPENLLLHRGYLEDQQQALADPLLKVADFGLCKSSSDSVPNSCVGSPHYMAPEVFTGREYDGRKADVFSCGVVLYQMVFGALPFSRSRDGRRLDFSRNFKEILENMREELWPQLLPHLLPATPPPATPAAAAAALPQSQPEPRPQTQLHHLSQPQAGAAAGVEGRYPEPSSELLSLLHGMLRYDAGKRLSLSQVMRHPWYCEGLTAECYNQLLSVDADEPDRSPEAAGAQSVELIEAEFARIIAYCATLQQAAASRVVDDVGDVGDP